MNPLQSAVSAPGDIATSSWIARALDRATWWVVAVSAAALLASIIFFAHKLWWPFPWVAALAFIAGASGVAQLRRGVTFSALLLVYGFPVLCRLGIGYFYWPLHALWLSALLGAAIGTRRYRWSLPPLMATSVALWTLTLTVGAALIALREANFTTATLHDFSVWNGGAPALLMTQGVLFAAAWVIVALVWCDSLSAAYRGGSWRTFALDVLLPLGTGWALATAIGVYQWRVDLRFVSTGFWANMRRATGTLLDANPFGAVCALWGPALAALALQITSLPLALVCAAASLGASWLGVWASGSRGAFVVAIVGTIGVVPVILRRFRSILSRAFLVVLLVAGAFLAFRTAEPTGPLQRLSILRWHARESPARALHELWDRDGYGAASMQMLQEHPWSGIGVGTLTNSIADFTPASLGYRLPPDNAQNWYRHQLAELGVVGSIGWIGWTLALGFLLLRGPWTGGSAGARWALIGFGLVSFVAMPGQEPAVGITIFALAAWCLRDHQNEHTHAPRTTWIAAAWILVVVAALAYAAVTIDAFRELAPPFRAARFGHPYQYGFHFDAPDLIWTDKKAVMVLNAPKPWMKLTVWVAHPDAAKRSVHVDVWKDHEHIVNDDLLRNARVTRYVQVAGAGKAFVLATRVDRTFTPAAGDSRELGLAMRWEFVDAPPQ